MRPSRGIFTPLWLFIVIVSVVDGFLVYENRSQIMIYELNPVGRALLLLNGGHVWYLLATKFVGTIAACGLLLLIHRRGRLGVVIASAVAAFQLCLLLFLTLA